MTPASDNLKRWIAALESGDYAQTTTQLAADGENADRAYCCLGVACDLYARDNHNDGAQWYGDEFELEDVNVFDALPPAVVIRDMGLEPEGVTGHGVNVVIQGVAASELNDEHGESFAQIAERLREEYDLVDADLTGYYTPKESN